jgi:hypothetical protein
VDNMRLAMHAERLPPRDHPARASPASRSILLNSSKQAHAPALARPLKNLPWRSGAVEGAKI